MLGTTGRDRSEYVMFTVRKAVDADRDQWVPLWKGYQEFYKVNLDDVTDIAENAVVAENGKKAITLLHATIV